MAGLSRTVAIFGAGAALAAGSHEIASGAEHQPIATINSPHIAGGGNTASGLGYTADGRAFSVKAPSGFGEGSPIASINRPLLAKTQEAVGAKATASCARKELSNMRLKFGYIPGSLRIMQVQATRQEGIMSDDPDGKGPAEAVPCSTLVDVTDVYRTLIERGGTMRVNSQPFNEASDIPVTVTYADSFTPNGRSTRTVSFDRVPTLRRYTCEGGRYDARVRRAGVDVDTTVKSKDGAVVGKDTHRFTSPNSRFTKSGKVRKKPGC